MAKKLKFSFKRRLLNAWDRYWNKSRAERGFLAYCNPHRTHWNMRAFPRCPICQQEVDVSKEIVLTKTWGVSDV